jgi:hypothetical protein
MLLMQSNDTTQNLRKIILPELARPDVHFQQGRNNVAEFRVGKLGIERK